MKFLLKIAIVLTCLFSTISAADMIREKDVMMLADYFDLIKAGNYMIAHDLWDEDALKRGEKFGIEYNNIPLKPDCVSPIIRNLNLMSNFLEPPVEQAEKLTPGQFSRLKFHAKIGNEDVRYNYYAINRGGYYWLTYPQDFYSLGWPQKVTKYFIINYHPEMDRFLNPTALAKADKFIEEMAKKLGLDDKMLKAIEEKKITYYYCKSDEMVENFTGHLTKGLYDLGSDDIISAFFPHYHELAHFLVNYKLQKQDLYVLPLLREGVAVCSGGRWGKSAPTILNVGATLFNQDIIPVDSILTVKGFETYASSDFAYFYAGLINGYLINKIGMVEYLKLYRDLSHSDLDKLAALKTEDIELILAKVCKFDNWDDFKTDFSNFVNTAYIEKSDITPGLMNDGRKILAENNYRIYEDEGWIGFEFKKIPAKEAGGNFVFGFDASLVGYGSSLLVEQYKGNRPFEGYRYGVKYDANEAGLYDYATNTLLAKYVRGFSPSDDYYNETDGTVTFKINRALFDSKFDKDAKYQFWSEE